MRVTLNTQPNGSPALLILVRNAKWRSTDFLPLVLFVSGTTKVTIVMNIYKVFSLEDGWREYKKRRWMRHGGFGLGFETNT